MWERGLKLCEGLTRPHNIASLPVWERGLKHLSAFQIICSVIVAPRVGAWIETTLCYIKTEQKGVAPRVGAWIETTGVCLECIMEAVAPRVGAWIETALNE